MTKKLITYRKFKDDVADLAKKLEVQITDKTSFYAIPRGGIPVALELTKYYPKALLVDKSEIDKDTIIIDDLIDSGKTIQEFDKNVIAVLYRKPSSPWPGDDLNRIICMETIDGWIEFFYEGTTKDIKDCALRILQYVEGNMK